MSLLTWSIEYDLPKYELALIYLVHAKSEEDAIKDFRKGHPHGRIIKINSQPVTDDGFVITKVNEDPTED